MRTSRQAELARHARRRASARVSRPDTKTVAVLGQVEDGRYRCRRDHWPALILVPSSPRDAVIPTPCRAEMGYEGGNPHLPVLLWYMANTISSQVFPVYPDYFADWFRYGVRMLGRHFAPEWDDPMEAASEIVFTTSGMTGAGTVVRADNEGAAYVAAGTELVVLDVVSGDATTSDLGAEIVSLCLGELTRRSYAGCLDYQTGTVGGDDYADGYDDGYEAADGESAMTIAQGASDCTSVEPYRAEELAAVWVAANVPGSGSPEYLDGWEDGATVAYIEDYNAGWELAGCVVP